jgi:hypothetical protein
MYYVFATKQWVEMDDSQESLEELEERITRDAIYASLSPDPWVEGTYDDGSTYWYNNITGTYAYEHPLGTREIIELEREIADAAEGYTRQQIQAADAAGGAEREPAIPAAAELQAVGSPTGIMDQQEFSGKVNKLKKLKKELRDAAAFLHHGINENDPHGAQWVQALNEEVNYDIANRWNRTHRIHREEVNVAHRPHSGFGPRSNFNRAVIARREAEGARYAEDPHAAQWAQVQDEMANEQDEALVEYNQQQRERANWEENGSLASNLTSVSRSGQPRHGLSRKARGREKVREQQAAAAARAQWANEQPEGEESLVDYNEEQAALKKGPRRKPAAHTAQWAQMNRELANEQWANELTENVRNQQWAQVQRERDVNPEWVGSQAGSQGGRRRQTAKWKANNASQATSQGSNSSRGRRTASQEAAYQAYHGKQWAKQMYPERFAQGANENNAEYALAQRNESQAASQAASQGGRRSRGRRPAAQAQPAAQWANEQEQQGAQWANEITGRYARHERQATAAARPLKERWNGALGANRLPNSSNNESV